MTWAINGVIRVLLVPADSGQPMRLMDVDSDRFERVLDGTMERVRACPTRHWSRGRPS
jgi:hypothetical protein